MKRRRRPDPIWAIMRYQGRTLAWLARQTGWDAGFVRQMACGLAPVPAGFRPAAAQALGLPEWVLFRDIPEEEDDGAGAGGASLVLERR